ncbi:MAG TPA: alpha/beta fold hydrolase [Pyrinomonadaceae bacterium]|nr:alpha/beta fold hydrolase [Pyrinomonadaceae bacterium]
MSSKFKVTEVTVRPLAGTRQSAPEQAPQATAALAFLESVARELQAKPFIPHPKFTSGHAQTLAAYYWPRGFMKRAHRTDVARIFEVERGIRVLAHCRWQNDSPAAHPTMVLVHGLEGANTSVYMLGTAEKAYRAGFNVVRVNLRNCGKTEHLTPTLYHAGLTIDLRAILRELITQDNLSCIFLVGFSMGGNITLMLAGEEGDSAPRELAGICAVSPTIDLRSCAEAIEWRTNRLYKWSFLRSMKKRVRRKRKLFPELYDTRGLSRLRKMREFDERYTIKGGGYSSVEEYYDRASSLSVLSQIRTPSLMIHAQDDPFVPFEPFRDPAIAANPHVVLLAPQHGGHVGFLGADASGEDRFWMENRLVEFCRLVSGGPNWNR